MIEFFKKHLLIITLIVSLLLSITIALLLFYYKFKWEQIAWFVGLPSSFITVRLVLKNKYHSIILYFITGTLVIYGVWCLGLSTFGLNKSEATTVDQPVKNNEVFEATPSKSMPIEDFSEPTSIRLSDNLSSRSYAPQVKPDILASMFTMRLYDNSFQQKDEDERITLLKDIILQDIEKNYRGKMSDDENSALNKNKNFSTLTTNANNLERELNEKKFSSILNVEERRRIINLREKASDISNTKDLLKLLGRDYYELGRVFIYKNDREQGFRCYATAIDYYTKAISYISINGNEKDEIYNILYTISSIYHSIGDIHEIKYDIQRDAYYMALAYLEIIADNKISFDSLYYKGMINHKLGIILKSSGGVYFMKALKDYNGCLNLPQLIPMKEINLNKWAGDVCGKMIIYIDKYKKIKDMLSKNEYKNKMKEYLTKWEFLKRN